MDKSSIDSGSQLTKILIGAIVVSVIALAWLVYAQLIAPRLAANVALSEQVCFADSQLCFSYPEAWNITEESTDDFQRFAFDSDSEARLMTLALGSMKESAECDEREARPLYVVSSQPTDLVAKAGEHDKQVKLVQAVIETAADGFFVPAIYLTSDDDHRQTGELTTCALEGANIVDLGDVQLASGVDPHDDVIGSNAPAYRSVGEAKKWFKSPDATIAYRILAGLQYASDPEK